MRSVAGCLLLTALLCASPAQAKPLELRVVTFNVWGLPWALAADRAQRIHAIGGELARLKPDLVALQEVWVPEDGQKLIAALKAAGLEHVHHESDGFLGSGLLIASRFPIKTVTFKPFSLAGKPHKPYHGDFYANKGMLVVLVETPLGTIAFANTHMHARYGTDEYMPHQITQVLEGAKALGNHGEDPPPQRDDLARPALILAGDLNTTLGAHPFTLLTTRTGLRPVTDDLNIDWILFRDGGRQRIRVKTVKTLFEEPQTLAGGLVSRLSDHPAVLAVLEVRQQEPAIWEPKVAQARWSKAASEALPVAQAALLESEESGSRGMRRTVVLLLLAAGFFLLGRRKRKKTKRIGCLLPLLTLTVLHLAVWTLYIGVVYEPTQQRGMAWAVRILEPPAEAEGD